MYSGELSLSPATATSIIHTANLLGVGAAEKAACDYFVESLEPPAACEALAFAAARATCGVHARGLHERCVAYTLEHFAACSAEPSFLDLPCEAVVALIGSDDLPVEEAEVLAAVRAWFDHDSAGRRGSLEALVPLVRWPLLPVEQRLRCQSEPLLLHMMENASQHICALGLALAIECSAEFAKSSAAATCSRLKRRKGTALAVPQLAFTAFEPGCYATSEGGALLTSTGSASYHAALCREAVCCVRGKSCAEFTVVARAAGTWLLIGVGRPTLDTTTPRPYRSGTFWGMTSDSGAIVHNNDLLRDWQQLGQRQGFGAGDVLRLLLDSDAGTLTVKKNDALLGVVTPAGLTGELCWAVCAAGGGGSVRIKAVDPAEF